MRTCQHWLPGRLHAKNAFPLSLITSDKYLHSLSRDPGAHDFCGILTSSSDPGCVMPMKLHLRSSSRSSHVTKPAHSPLITMCWRLRPLLHAAALGHT